jgi:hypothetical protein
MLRWFESKIDAKSWTVNLGVKIKSYNQFLKTIKFYSKTIKDVKNNFTSHKLILSKHTLVVSI